MDSRGVILFITRHDPSGHSGGSFATRAYLESICKLYPNRVVLFVNEEFNNSILTHHPLHVITSKRRGRLIGLIQTLVGKMDRHRGTVNKWLKNNKDTLINLVICDGSFIGGVYAPFFKSKGIKTITIYHNYEVEFRMDNKSIESLFGVSSYWIRKLEKASYKNSDLNLFLTKSDMEVFENVYGGSQNSKILGCYEFPRKHSRSSTSMDVDTTKVEGTKLKMVISGSLNTVQSIESIKWFLSEVYSSIMSEEIFLTITGRKPSESFSTFLRGYRKLNLIPNPEDMQRVLTANDLYVCPLFMGGGIKLRIMDALAIGLPGVIHSKSIRGYEEFVQLGIINKFDDRESFIQALEDLKKKIISNKINREIVKKKYNSLFSFNAGTQRMESFLIENRLI